MIRRKCERYVEIPRQKISKKKGAVREVGQLLYRLGAVKQTPPSVGAASDYPE